MLAELREAGELVGVEALGGPAQAKIVRAGKDGLPVTDGVFPETKEFLGGFFLIDCPDLDAALRYAAKMPMEDYGTVEVRPMMFPAGTPAREMDTQTAA